jgi:hypothetical protein
LGEITQWVISPSGAPSPSIPLAIGAIHHILCACTTFRYRPSRVQRSARGLHKRGRRRIILGSDWVSAPSIVSGQSARFITAQEESTMKWTKPEAEVVAVTMEVTAYVATL